MLDQYVLPRFVQYSISGAKAHNPKITQRVLIGRILTMAEGRWVCGSEFYANYMPTYSQRIGELVRGGAPIARAGCTNPEHRHEGNLAQYRLEKI